MISSAKIPQRPILFDEHTGMVQDKDDIRLLFFYVFFHTPVEIPYIQHLHMLRSHGEERNDHTAERIFEDKHRLLAEIGEGMICYVDPWLIGIAVHRIGLQAVIILPLDAFLVQQQREITIGIYIAPRHGYMDAVCKVRLQDADILWRSLGQRHLLALAAQKVVMIHIYVIVVQIKMAEVNIHIVIIAQRFRYHLRGHQAGLRLPMLIGTEEQCMKPLCSGSMMESRPQVQGVNPGFSRTGQEFVHIRIGKIPSVIERFIAILVYSQKMGSVMPFAPKPNMMPIYPRPAPMFAERNITHPRMTATIA